MKCVIDGSTYTAGKAIRGTMMDLVTDPDRLKAFARANEKVH
jgi:hypothetical protein